MSCKVGSVEPSILQVLNKCQLVVLLTGFNGQGTMLNTFQDLGRICPSVMGKVITY